MGKQAKTGESDTPTPGKSVRVMAAAEFQRFHKQAVTLKGRADEANTDRGDFISKAAKEKGLNKSAYNFAAKIDAALNAKVPKPDAAAEMLASFRRYSESLDLEGRCNLQGRLEFDGTGKPSAVVKAEPGTEPEQKASSDDDRDFRPGFLQVGSSDPGPAAGGGAQERVRELARASGALSETAPTEPPMRGKRRAAGEEPNNPETKH